MTDTSSPDLYTLEQMQLEHRLRQAEALEKCHDAFALAMLKIARLHERGDWTRAHYLAAANVLLSALKLAEAQITIDHGLLLTALDMEAICLQDEAVFATLKEMMKDIDKA